MALILTVIFLLLAGSVEAESPTHKQPSYSWIHKDFEGMDLNKVAANDSIHPCLAQMEQAMRAMEPYMVEMEGTNIWFVYKNINPDGFKPAKKLWNEAKRDCWRTP